ncbi:hypothetical protein NP233_g1475 [Leucocoprinus birnbaumii]|uniref:Uncharacterized protein n=1 Tax=Leucocoprinus birnbaumii TaxID=56174 RepID=A0AAD5VZV5_9AGAR|nr:hypothetical protein NP233_g1475 [Leucocoprinus birnbaumii]
MEVTSTFLSVQTQESTLVITVTHFPEDTPTSTKRPIHYSLPVVDVPTGGSAISSTNAVIQVATLTKVVEVPHTITAVVTFTNAQPESTGKSSSSDLSPPPNSSDRNQLSNRHLARILPPVLITPFLIVGLILIFLYRRRTLRKRRLGESKPIPFVATSQHHVSISNSEHGHENNPRIHPTIPGQIVKTRVDRPTSNQFHHRFTTATRLQGIDIARTAGHPPNANPGNIQPQFLVRSLNAAGDPTPLTQADLLRLQTQLADIEARRINVTPPPDYSPHHPD